MKPRALFKVYQCNPASQQSECFWNISGLGGVGKHHSCITNAQVRHRLCYLVAHRKREN